MSTNGYTISKTSFLKFEQCKKAFFLYKNHPYLRDKISIDKQLTFKRGHDVGSFAQQLFPGGIDVSKEVKGADAAATLTKQLIDNKSPVIYEATFIYNGVLIMVDILHLSNGRYQAYEVKSSVKISETYLKDAYLQYYVLKQTLMQFDDLFLVTLNPGYILETTINPKQLFRKRSVKIKAEENIAYFNHQIHAAHALLEQNAIPNIAIGTHCFRPYTCDFFGTCWKNIIQPNSIFNLPLINKTKLVEWYDAGIRNIEDLHDPLIEKPDLIKIKQAFINNETIIDKKRIVRFLSQIKEPAGSMDMEIWNPAIPQIEGTKPFEQVPFLVCFYNGKTNTHFFSGYEKDSRKQFAEALIQLSQHYASIIVYDKTMEFFAIESLARLYPDLKNELSVLNAKLVDVFELFSDLVYYSPEFKTNFSLKAVSAVLLDDIHYSRINSGLEAMNYYENYRSCESAMEKELFKNELINYCSTDTTATLKLIDFFRKLIA